MYEAAGTQFTNNRALHQASPSGLPRRRLPQNYWGFFTGIASLTSTVTIAARTLNPAVVDLEDNKVWKRVEIYRALVALYLGREKTPLEWKNSGKNPGRKTRDARSIWH